MEAYGYKEQHILSGKAYYLNGPNGLTELPVLREDGQYDDVLPIHEIQRSAFFDSMSCVTFAILNAVETVINLKYREENYADRYLAAKSGTSCAWGNYVATVAKTLHDSGVCYEAYYTWDKEEVKTCSEYMKEVTAELDMLAKLNFLERYEYRYAWAYDTTQTEQDARKQALQYGPLTVSVYAGAEAPIKGGVFQRQGTRHNHYVLCYGYEEEKYWKVYDHYENKFKRYAWDYNFSAEMLHVINKKSEMDLTEAQKELEKKDMLKGTFLVQQTGEDGSGEFGVLIDSVLHLGKLDEITATYLVRGGSPGGGLTKELWVALEHRDLKGNQLNNLN